MYAQIIDDTVGNTLCAASTMDKDVKAACEKTNNVDAAAQVGTAIAKKALEKGITTAVSYTHLIHCSRHELLIYKFFSRFCCKEDVLHYPG